MDNTSQPDFSRFKIQNWTAHGNRSPHDEAVTFNANIPTMHSQLREPPTGRGIRQNHPWNQNISSFCAYPTLNLATPNPGMLTTSARHGLFTPQTPSHDEMYVWDSNPCRTSESMVNRPVSMEYVHSPTANYN